MFEDDFEELVKLMEPRVIARTAHPNRRRYAATQLCLRAHVLLLLHWLRQYPTYDTLAELYNKISAPCVSREINYLLPRFFT